MKCLAITTFNDAGRKLYGDRMAASFRANWPIPLRVYSEGFAGDVDLISASPWLADFKDRNRSRPVTDYRFDAVRFAHKVASVCHAAREDVDFVIWVDGDTFTHSPVSEADIAGMLPGFCQWIAWLDRVKLYPECGFFVLNCRHPRHAEMIDQFERMYSEDRLYSLPEYHDSFVLEHVVKSSGIATTSLSGEGYRTSHPFINGPLGRWMDHMKGPRKNKGRTPARERVVKDGSDYWK